MCSCIGIKHAFSFSLLFVKDGLPYLRIAFLVMMWSPTLHSGASYSCFGCTFEFECNYEFELGLLSFLRSCTI